MVKKKKTKFFRDMIKALKEAINVAKSDKQTPKN